MMDYRMKKLLERLSEGFVEEESGLPADVGKKTIEEALARGWIERAVCETYDTNGYRITQAGEDALDVEFNRGRLKPGI